MINSTADQPVGQVEATCCPRLDDEQTNYARQGWYFARIVAWKWERHYPGPDYQGEVAERLTRAALTYDPSKSEIKPWALGLAAFACRDAIRKHRAANRLGAYQLSAVGPTTEGIRDEPDEIAVRDRPGHLEQIDAIKYLLRDANQRERLLILEHYVLGRKLHEIAADHGVSGSTISGIHRRFIRRMQSEFTARLSA